MEELEGAIIQIKEGIISRPRQLFSRIIYTCRRTFSICITHAYEHFMGKRSPRFLCRLTALIKLLVAVQRQRVLCTETIEFASPAIGSAHFHVSWLSDFIFYHKPYINRFTNHFSIHS